eukprot:scaffold2846_cov125-Isochrysis_galbana.AAC.3
MRAAITVAAACSRATAAQVAKYAAPWNLHASTRWRRERWAASVLATADSTQRTRARLLFRRSRHGSCWPSARATLSLARDSWEEATKPEKKPRTSRLHAVRCATRPNARPARLLPAAHVRILCSPYAASRLHWRSNMLAARTPTHPERHARIKPRIIRTIASLELAAQRCSS